MRIFNLLGLGAPDKPKKSIEVPKIVNRILADTRHVFSIVINYINGLKNA
jgi:hypothetical protein